MVKSEEKRAKMRPLLSGKHFIILFLNLLLLIDFLTMTITLKVPSIACDACADTITKAIHTHESEAEVSVDVDNKVVEVDTQASEASIKQIIESAGYPVET